MRKRVLIKVSGRVQGVFFRASAQAEAVRLGVAGWIKNDSEGAVRICAEGEEKTLQKFIAWCYNGSRFAEVEDINTQWREATGEFTDFTIR